MKVEIPDAVKADIPPTRWGKVLASTPVIMAVIATALAGLSSSEMSKAQYLRSLAAQQQSKAGDQWGYYQAKRLRETVLEEELDVLNDREAVQPLDAAAFSAAVKALPAGGDRAADRDRLAQLVESPAGQAALLALAAGATAAPPAAALPPAVASGLAGLQAPSAGPAAVEPLSDEVMASALRAARDQVAAYDQVTKPIAQAIDQGEALLRTLAGDAQTRLLQRSLLAARLRWNAARYASEAHLNQTIANLEELAVARSNHAADHHHERSGRFFLGMLAAQLGVIVATMAIAAKKRNLLWGFAAAAGLVSVVFASYVFAFV